MEKLKIIGNIIFLSMFLFCVYKLYKQNKKKIGL